MEARRSYKTLLPIYLTTWYHIPDNCNIHNYDNLTSHTQQQITLKQLTFPSRETIKRDLDPPAICMGLRADKASEYTGSFTLEPFSPPNWSLSFNPQTNTLVWISGLESTKCPLCWVANTLTSCRRKKILNKAQQIPGTRLPQCVKVSLWYLYFLKYSHSKLTQPSC